MRVPAPIDAASLSPVLTRSIINARTLPAAAYLSPAVFAWEREVLFARSWVCAGRIADGCAFQAMAIAGTEVLITRDGAQVRAFHNVCRHRGHELLARDECREAIAITCPYHAWSFSLDGSLRSAPRFTGLEGFDAREHALIPVRAAVWQGWVFVNLSGGAPPLEAAIGNLDALVAPWQPERLVVGANHAYTVLANWKTIVENFHECYHCPSVHPELCAVTDLASGGNVRPDGLWLGGPMSLKATAHTMSLDGQSHGARIPGVSDAQARQVHYYFLFPNWLVSLHPDYVMTHRLQPIDETRTSVQCTWLFAAEAMNRPGFDPAYAVDFWDLTNRQDWAACESVARGIASPGFRPGPVTWREDGVHAFMAMIARAYLDGAVSRPDILMERPSNG